MAVPYTFSTATGSLPLSQLDSNFSTAITIGNTAVVLGDTITTINNLTLGNVAITSVSSAFPNGYLANSNVIVGTTTLTLGSTVTSINGLSLSNVTISSGNVTISNVTTTNVTATTANVTTANVGTLVVIGDATVGGNTTVTGNITAAKGTFTSANVTGTANVQVIAVTQNATVAGNVTITGNVSAANGTFTSANVSGAANVSTLAVISNVTIGGNATVTGNVSMNVATITTANVSGTANVSTLVITANQTSLGNITATGNVTAAKLIPTGTSVTGNGLYLPAANALGLSTNGTNAVYIDSSQNVGIGTSSPQGKLQVFASANDNLIVAGHVNASDGAALKSMDSTGASYKAFEVLSAELRVGGTNGILFGTSGTGGSTERMRIDASGNVLVGTTNTSATAGAGMKFSFADPSNPVVKNVVADGSGAYSTWNLYSTNAGAYRFFVTTAGVINATTIVITAISDQRLKENIRDIDAGLDAILALKPRRFDWKTGKGQDKKNAAGFIAQEFEDVFPECVGTSEVGEDGIAYKNINHETLIPALVKAIQEQQTLITALTARITALENK